MTNGSNVFYATGSMWQPYQAVTLVKRLSGSRAVIHWGARWGRMCGRTAVVALNTLSPKGA